MQNSKKVAKKKKKRSQAPIALVYFAALSICLVLIGGVVLTLFQKYDMLSLGGSNGDSYEGYTSKDCSTMLFVRINSKNMLNDMMIMRVDPTKDKVFLVPVSPYTVNVDTGKTLRQTLETQGIGALTSSVSQCFGVDIDRYMTISNSAFENICDLLGGYTYTPSEDLYYLSGQADTEVNDITLKKSKTETLMGRKIRLIMSYPVFSEGKQGNVKFMAGALETMFKNAFSLPESTKANLDTLYQIASKKSDTNMTEKDYSKLKSVINDMLSRGVSPVVAYTPTGSWNEDETRFTVSETFREELSNQFIPEVMAASSSSEDK